MSRRILPNRKATKQSSSPPLTNPQVALYTRVSTEDQAERGTIGAQRDFLRQFAQLYQLPVAGEYADDGISGTVLLGERPDGQRLLQDGQAGRFGCVLVYRVDRLGRSLTALLDAHSALSQAGITLRSATEPFDTSTPIGTFLFQLLGSLAELEKATISERMTLGRDRVARGGRWTGGPIPFGYDLDAQGQLTPSARLVESLGITEAEVAREVFERLAAGGTAHAEAQRLNIFKVPTARRYGGGKEVQVGAQWLPSRLSYMLRNSVYMGQHVYKSKHGTLEREVPALVSSDVWERVQQRIKQNRSLPKGNATRVYLLRSLIRCMVCGSTYVGSPGATTKAGRLYYYRCSELCASNQPEPGKRCRSVAIRAERLEDLVWEHCREFIRNPGPALAEAKQRVEARMQQRGRLDVERSRLQQALAAHGAERERVMTLFRRGRARLEEAEAHLDAIEREAETIRTQLGALRAQQDLAEAMAAHHAEATALLGGLRDRLDEVERTNDVQIKRQVVDVLVARIQVETIETARRTKQGRVTIHFTFAPKRVSDFTTALRTEESYTLERLLVCGG